MHHEPDRRGLRGVRVAVVGELEVMTYNAAAALGRAGAHVEVFFPADDTPLRASRHVARYDTLPQGVLRTAGASLARWLAPILERRAIDVIVPADFHATMFLARHGHALWPRGFDDVA